MSTSISELMNSMGAAHSEGSTSASEMMPFGTKTEMVEIVPLQNLHSGSSSLDLIILDENKNYKVVLNGVEYICKPQYVEESQLWYIGNPAFLVVNLVTYHLQL